MTRHRSSKVFQARLVLDSLSDGICFKILVEESHVVPKNFENIFIILYIYFLFLLFF
jgi:hypothetical protein